MKDKIISFVLLIGVTVGIIIITLLLKMLIDKCLNLNHYTKAICNINNEQIEINIKEIKLYEGQEYSILDDEDHRWLLSTHYCTFVEE